MDEDKQLQKLQGILELVNKDYVDPDEFVQAFEVALTLIETLKENTSDAFDTVEEKIEESEKTINQIILTFNKKVTELEKSLKNEKGESDKEVKKLISTLKSDFDEKVDSLRQAFPKIDLSNIEGDIKELKARKMPEFKEETPDETIEKVNKSKKLINRERIEGLVDIERIAKSNQGYFSGISEVRALELIRQYAPTSPGGGGGTWGSITGTLSDQTDLQTALDEKQDDITFGSSNQLAFVNIAENGFSFSSRLTFADVEGTLTVQSSVDDTSLNTLVLKNNTGDTRFAIDASGTVVNGLWNGDVVSLGYGGTGVSLSAPGDTSLWGWIADTGSIGYITLGSGLSMTSDGTLSATAGSGATTALDNLASVAINSSLLFDADATYDIGSSTVGVNDLHFSSGAVTNYNNGNVTVTHSAANLTLAGSGNANLIINSGYAWLKRNGTGSGFYLTDTSVASANSSWGVNMSSTQQLIFATYNAGLSLISNVLTINRTGVAIFTNNIAVPATSGVYLDGGSNTFISEVSADVIRFTTGGTGRLDISSAGIFPVTSNNVGLGTTSRQWNGLHLAEGAAINWDNGDMTVTQVGNLLTIAGGDLAVVGKVIAKSPDTTLSAELKIDNFQNIAVGTTNFGSITSGQFNVAIGRAALGAVNSGSSNFAFGENALAAVTTGSNNVAIGVNSGTSMSTASLNTFIGGSAGQLVTGQYNTIIGSLAGTTLTSGGQNIIIGHDNEPASATASGQIVIGNLIYGTTATGTGSTISTGSIGIGTNAPDRRFHVEVSDAGTNSVTFAQRLSHITSGTVATGFGTGYEIELENASGTNVVVATQEYTFSDATNASEDATWKLRLMLAGTLTDAISVSSEGYLTVNNQININGAWTQFQATTADVDLNFKTVAGTGRVVFSPNATDSLFVDDSGITTPVDYEVTDSSKGVILKSPDGTRYRVTVNNGGTLAVAAA